MVKQKNKKIKVVLTESLYKTKPGEVISVAPGYASYLVRYGLAIRERGNEELINQKLLDWKKSDEQKIIDAKAIEQRLQSINLVLERQSGLSGALYGSVNASDIMRELQKLGCDIKRKDIVMESIRSIGKYTININLYGGGKASMEVTINGESE